MSKPVVVVPVFNAFEALDACLAALDRTLPAATPVHVADDASTDPRIAPLLAAWRVRTRLDATVVTRPQNLGFPANCNAAFVETGAANVILLNTDAEPQGDWYRRLQCCADSDTRIASVTPFTNNGEIVSFPRFIEPNPAPEPLGDWVAAIEAGPPLYPELPTAVGFCMFLRRAALDQIGDFDAATFGRGYGEENDWCLRAEAMGWRHVLCDDAFVLHRGGASFAALGLRPGGGNLARLNGRWPGYNARIARFIMDDPLRPARERVFDTRERLRAANPQGDLFL